MQFKFCGKNFLKRGAPERRLTNQRNSEKFMASLPLGGYFESDNLDLRGMCGHLVH